jgi:hypothetical protein
MHSVAPSRLCLGDQLYVLRANLMSKLNVHDLASLIRAAIKHGLIFPEE